MTPTITSLDHLVLTVSDIDKSLQFYGDVLGMRAQASTSKGGTRRWALKFGTQKVNLHQAGAEFEPKAERPGPGTADLCFLSDTPLADWVRHLQTHNIPIEEGPVKRTGAIGQLNSIYVRDPDGNLIEISNQGT